MKNLKDSLKRNAAGIIALAGFLGLFIGLGLLINHCAHQRVVYDPSCECDIVYTVK